MNISIIVPNWNGSSYIEKCINSLLEQSIKLNVIVVDNGSVDDSIKILKSYGKKIYLINLNTNIGFAGGVNVGIRKAMELYSPDYIGLLNNDAVADRKWVENLISGFYKDTGIVTSLMLDASGNRIDSTGEFYSKYGISYSRNRGDEYPKKLIPSGYVFGASGGASIYRTIMLENIGLFDEDFFAYYEDVDISFRARLNGWQIKYQPEAIVYHQIGATSRKLKGFTTYQTMKNLPWLLIKNVPLKYLFQTILRFNLVYTTFLISSALRGELIYALKGMLMSVILIPKKLVERHGIQKSRKIRASELWKLVVNDLPPNAYKLRKIRKILSLGNLK